MLAQVWPGATHYPDFLAVNRTWPWWRDQLQRLWDKVGTGRAQQSSDLACRANMMQHTCHYQASCVKPLGCSALKQGSHMYRASMCVNMWWTPQLNSHLCADIHWHLQALQPVLVSCTPVLPGCCARCRCLMMACGLT